MTGQERRNQILQMLKNQNSPLSGAVLAKEFGVSRQVIVQDIALIRAEYPGILSTNKGYLFHAEDGGNPQPRRVFFVKHTTDQVLDEFLTITELGGHRAGCCGGPRSLRADPGGSADRDTKGCPRFYGTAVKMPG